MRDAHVVALYYRLETDSSLIFENALPRDDDRDECTFRLAQGVLTCTMKGHYATAAEARAPVDLYLRSWELAEALPHGRRMLWFTFDKAEIIDRDPPSPRNIPGVVREPGGVRNNRGRCEAPSHPCKLSPPLRRTSSPPLIGKPFGTATKGISRGTRTFFRWPISA